MISGYMAELVSTSTVESIEGIGGGFSEAQKAQYPWHALVEEQRSEEALEAIEQQMKERPNDPICRLWWVRCQLEIDTLPTTALSAPLDELFDKLNELPELKALYCGTYLRTARKLVDKDQYRLAVVMLERALSLSDSISREDRSSLESFALQVVDDEIKRAQLRRENRSYISSLETKKELLEKQVQEHSQAQLEADQEKKPEQPHRPGRLSAKQILNEAAEQTQPEDEESVPVGPSKKWRWAIAAMALPIAVGTIGWELWQYSMTSKQATLPDGVAMNIELRQKPEMTLPTIKSGGNELDRTLDNVGMRLAKLALASKEKPAGTPGTDPGIDHDALNPKHAATLDQPVAPENDELESIANIPDARNAIPANKLPSYDPSNAPGGTVESVGSSPSKAPIPKAALGKDLKVDSAGRIYGPAKSADPVQIAPRRNALDGSPLRSYEVEQFNPPIVYTTIARTRVVSAPSLLNETLAELNANTPVHVTARMGRWLELRSTGGKVGYIYSQDARPSNQVK